MARVKQELKRPPRLATALLRMISTDAVREAVLGDLHEGYCLRVQSNLNDAAGWYWRQVLSSAAPLLRRRIERSAISSALLVLLVSALAFASVNMWDVVVARNVAQAFMTSFDAATMPGARVLYIMVQAVWVGVSALIVALITFRPEVGFLQNTLTRLTILGLLILVPPFAAHFLSKHGYPFAFLWPWALATTAALGIGAFVGMRIVHRRL